MLISDITHGKGAARNLTDEERLAWGLLFALGMVLLLVGTLDIALAWAPMNLGNADWEFGVVSSTFNSMPVPSVGLGLATASLIVRGRKVGVILAATWALVVVLFLLGAGVLYLLDLPLALKAMQEPVARTALSVAMAKSAASFCAYASLHAAMFFVSARALRLQ